MDIKVERHFAFSAEQIWAIVGDPVRVDWVPGVESCVFDGEVRAFSMGEAGALKERILRRDHATRTLEYTVIESAMPLEHHHAALRLESEGDGARFIWETSVKPDQVAPFIKRSMNGALDQLENVLAGSSDLATG